jgi:hypothetical protein
MSKKISKKKFDSLILGSTLKSVQNEYMSTWKSLNSDELLRVYGQDDKGISVLFFIKVDPTPEILSIDFYIEVYCKWNKKNTKITITEVKSNINELTYNGHRITVIGKNQVKIKKDKK